MFQRCVDREMGETLRATSSGVSKRRRCLRAPAADCMLGIPETVAKGEARQERSSPD